MGGGFFFVKNKSHDLVALQIQGQIAESLFFPGDAGKYTDFSNFQAVAF